jgi:hypothetical protein
MSDSSSSDSPSPSGAVVVVVDVVVAAGKAAAVAAAAEALFEEDIVSGAAFSGYPGGRFVEKDGVVVVVVLVVVVVAAEATCDMDGRRTGISGGDAELDILCIRCGILGRTPSDAPNGGDGDRSGRTGGSIMDAIDNVRYMVVTRAGACGRGGGGGGAVGVAFGRHKSDAVIAVVAAVVVVVVVVVVAVIIPTATAAGTSRLVIVIAILVVGVPPNAPRAALNFSCRSFSDNPFPLPLPLPPLEEREEEGVFRPLNLGDRIDGDITDVTDLTLS